MRHRSPADAVQPPAMLLRFDPADWPAHYGDRYSVAAFELWRRARAEFDRVHGWPGDTVQRLQEQVAEQERHISERSGLRFEVSPDPA